MQLVTRALTILLLIVVTIPSTLNAEETDSWIYQQSTGQLRFGSKSIGKGYSGNGEGLNNPAKESMRDIGPIPRGEWAIGDAFKHDTKGPIVMRLTPVGHKAHERDGFLIHGDNSKMDQSASNGCIILSRELRENISKSDVKKLLVEE